jgi:hypothetical protein
MHVLDAFYATNNQFDCQQWTTNQHFFGNDKGQQESTLARLVW